MSASVGRSLAKGVSSVFTPFVFAKVPAMAPGQPRIAHLALHTLRAGRTVVAVVSLRAGRTLRPLGAGGDGVNDVLQPVELVAHLRAGIRRAGGGLGGVEGHWAQFLRLLLVANLDERKLGKPRGAYHILIVIAQRGSDREFSLRA